MIKKINNGLNFQNSYLKGVAFNQITLFNSFMFVEERIQKNEYDCV